MRCEDAASVSCNKPLCEKAVNGPLLNVKYRGKRLVIQVQVYYARLVKLVKTRALQA